MKIQNLLLWMTLLLSLSMPRLSNADTCTEQGGTRQGDWCKCGDVVFNPATHHCADQETLQPGPIQRCSVCHEGIIAGSVTVSCRAGHLIEKGECLKDLVRVSGIGEQARAMDEHEIPCPQGDCKERIQVKEIEKVLGANEQCVRDLKTRLGDIKGDCSTAAADPSHGSHATAVRDFRSKVEDAFNLCCPGVRAIGDRCGGYLSPIEGCNAATCENCQTTFCYLCLEQQANSAIAHAHIRDLHSGDYWERRDGHTGQEAGPTGYTEVETYSVTEDDPNHRARKRTRTEQVPYTYKDRYHWLLIRRKLEALFQDQKDEGIKRKVLTEVEPLFRKNKIWPLPFTTEHWIEAVMNDPHIDHRNKVALLQNEHIYQNQLATLSAPVVSSSIANPSPGYTQAPGSSDAIIAKLRELNAPVLTSLDVPRVPVAGAAVPAMNRNVTPLLENHEDASIRHAFAHLRQHAGPFFAVGGANGNLYRISDPEVDPARRVPAFILSKAALERMSHEGAAQYCQDRGARLPNVEELRAFSRAMSVGGRYNPDLIPGMRGCWLWSLSILPEDAAYAFVFYGAVGNVGSSLHNSDYNVRCVVAEPQG